MVKTESGRHVWGANHDGYRKVMGRDRVKVYVHRLVAEAFLPNPEGLPEVNHINGVRHDNRVANLEWVSHADNMRHAYSTGLNPGRRRVRC
jgi:hypothetical protein